MIVLSAKNLNKSYLDLEVLRDVSFYVNEGEKIGLIGDNGAGKTTLLRLLSGEEEADSGELFVAADKSVGYMRQRDSFPGSLSVYEAAMLSCAGLVEMEKEIARLSEQISRAASENGETEALLHRLDATQQEFDRLGGYKYRSEVNGMLSSMGFSSLRENRIDKLSGGERTRLALACLLLEKPDILLLDEPTNHLDIDALSYLEQYLRAYRGTVVLISHDRYFLDNCVSGIYEIENHRLSVYKCGYGEYAKEKEKRREAALRRYEKQQEEIARQEEIIRRFKEHGTEHLAKRALSREKRLEHMELEEKPGPLRRKVKIKFRQDFKSGRDVIHCEGLSKYFGFGRERRLLFKNVDFDVQRGERICIIGANGIGKTTLLRILMEETSPDGGHIDIGYNVEFGYYDQGQRLLNDAATVLEEMKDSYRLYSDTEMRSILGRFLFTGDEVFKSVASLSGGERARLSLLKLMLSNANVLLLDEPTNHLDISSKEVFEDALLDFPGTVVTVTHDRYFLNKIAEKIFELTPDGMNVYAGGYDYYLRKKVEREASLPETEKKTAERQSGELSAAEERRLKKEKEAEERRKLRESAAAEESIAELEAEIAKIEAELCAEENFSRHELLSELSERLSRAKEELSAAYERWYELSAEL